jgi:hypothetical protein
VDDIQQAMVGQAIRPPVGHPPAGEAAAVVVEAEITVPFVIDRERGNHRAHPLSADPFRWGLLK